MSLIQAQHHRLSFVALLIAGIALAVPNMAWAFGIGIVVDLFLRRTRTKI